MGYYYTLIKILHIIGMASWFGVALSISIILSKKDTKDYRLILDLMTKVEMPASFFMPLTGVLMMIENTNFLTMSWLHIKIMISLLAIVFTHLSRAHLIHSDLQNPDYLNKFLFYRNLSLFSLLIVIIFVGYK
ncbi:hypothetical protein DBW60_05230 [bacterium]|nr:MAG: hypothetical protein DBW60_05230 [bacterium]|tara:strand:- start:15 stop:413 length:399 start_codon:yes stop_codon:yes gene_type:complete